MKAPSGPVKVCFVCPKAYKLFNPDINEVIGGAEVDCYLLAVELAKDSQFEVSFVTADYGQPAIEMRQNVKIIKSLTFGQNSLIGAIKIWRAMKHANADVYLLKTASLGVPLALVFCRLNNKIFAYRNASTPDCDGTYRKLHPVLGAAFDWSLRKADFVFTQNSTDKEHLERRIGVCATVIPNGHVMPPLVEHKRDIILWVGRSGEIKNPGMFLDLAEKLPDEKFVMICQRATGDKIYDSLVARAGQLRNLEFIEHVPFFEVDKYFQRSKVLVNTSLAEGFPNTFIQACKCATPVVSLTVDPDGFLEKYDCGRSCNGKFNELFETLKAMLADQSYIALGQNCRRYVEETHDISKIITTYKTMFCGLVGGKREIKCAE